MTAIRAVVVAVVGLCTTLACTQGSDDAESHPAEVGDLIHAMSDCEVLGRLSDIANSVDDAAVRSRALQLALQGEWTLLMVDAATRVQPELRADVLEFAEFIIPVSSEVGLNPSDAVELLGDEFGVQCD